MKDWHLDRKVTFAMLGALLLNAGTGAWWAATTNKRIEYLEAAILTQASVPNRLTVLETQYVFIQSVLQDIKTDVKSIAAKQEERRK